VIVASFLFFLRFFTTHKKIQDMIVHRKNADSKLTSTIWNRAKKENFLVNAKEPSISANIRADLIFTAPKPSIAVVLKTITPRDGEAGIKAAAASISHLQIFFKSCYAIVNSSQEIFFSLQLLITPGACRLVRINST
jgi:hypothetical protein